ncbi:MAG: hypothetical protein QXD64_05145, partial [Thermoplasmata archaeon]
GTHQHDRYYTEALGETSIGNMDAWRHYLEKRGCPILLQMGHTANASFLPKEVFICLSQIKICNGYSL